MRYNLENASIWELKFHYALCVTPWSYSLSPFSELLYIILFSHMLPSVSAIYMHLSAQLDHQLLQGSNWVWITVDRTLCLTIVGIPTVQPIKICWVNEEIRNEWVWFILLSYLSNAMPGTVGEWAIVCKALTHTHDKNLLCVKYHGKQWGCEE